MDGDLEPRTKERNVSHAIFCSTIRSLKTVQATHQFLSLALLRDSTRPHRADDDIESFLWVLLWVAIRHAPNSLTSEERRSLLMQFDVSSVDWRIKLALVSNGRHAIVGELGYQLTSQALADVLAELVGELSGAVARADAQAQAHWSTHDWMLGVLARALRDEKWKAVKDHSVHYLTAQYSTDKPNVQKKIHDREVDEQRRTKKRRREDDEEGEGDEESEEDEGGEYDEDEGGEDDEWYEDDKGKDNEAREDEKENGRELKRMKISGDQL